MPLLLASPAFAPGGKIPAEYTCSGADISPPLTWSGVPAGARSLVLVDRGPGCALGRLSPLGRLRHSGRVRTGSRPATGRTGRPAGCTQARNDFGSTGYGGPCPPPGPAHHYRFQLHRDQPADARPGGIGHRPGCAAGGAALHHPADPADRHIPALTDPVPRPGIGPEFAPTWPVLSICWHPNENSVYNPRPGGPVSAL